MSRLLSSSRSVAAAATCVLVAAFAGAIVAAGPAAAKHPAGAIGKPVTLARAQDMPGDHPYDVATTSSGTAYIGWIADDVGTSDARSVHLCTLPVSATRCSGGVQTIAIDGASTASGLHVLATGSGATLLWFHDTATAGDGPEGGAIAEATAAHGQNLGAAHDLYPAPSHGELLDAELGSNGALWTVSYAGVGKSALQVNAGSSVTTLHAPFDIGLGQLGFAGRTAVLALTKYGQISTPAAFASDSGSWSGFSKVPGTWTGGGLALKGTGHGLRLVTGVDNASYRPVLAKWNGHGFDKRSLTADHNNCGPSSHDAATDPSGRLVDVSWECNDITIANYADGAHAAITRVAVGGTTTYSPQIGESTRGIASVAWTNEDVKGGSDLRVSHVRLGTASRTVTGHARGGTVRVTGPVSCLPVSDAKVGIGAAHAHGWHVVRRSLTLGSAPAGSFVDGEKLAAGKTYTLHGVAVFGKGSAHSTARAKLAFRTC